MLMLVRIISAVTLSLVLAKSATASPVNLGQGSQKHRRDVGEILADKEKFCNGFDTSTAEGARAAWYDTGAGLHVEDFISIERDGEPKDWLKRYEEFALKDYWSGQTNSDRCSHLGQDCEIGMKWDCYEYWQHGEDDGNDWIKTAYWISQALKRVHSKFSVVRNVMHTDAMVTSLKIDSMISDFDGNDDNTEGVIGWVTAAVGMGASVLGLDPRLPDDQKDKLLPGGVTAGMGIFASILGQVVGELEDDGIDSNDIKSALGDVFAKSITHLETTLRAVMGSSRDDSAYEELPHNGWRDLTSSVASFLDGGWWLIEDDTDKIYEMLNATSFNLRRKAADSVLQAADYQLVGDMTRPTKESCAGEVGRRWLDINGEDGPVCFFIAKEDRDNTWPIASASIYEKMAEHGIDFLDAYYRNAIGCHLSDKEDKSTPSVSDLTIGDIPRCFFNMPVKRLVTDHSQCNPNSRNYNCRDVRAESF